MSITNPHLILVNGDTPASDAVAAAAALAFPQWQFSHATSLDAARLQAPSEAEILLLLDPPADVEQTARQMLLEDGLPRWAVLVLSYGAGPAAPLDHIPQQEWQPAALARHLRQALVQLELARRCARHQGDLHTIARRIRHDLNTPLNGIVSMAELIQDITVEDHPEVKTLLASIFEAVDGMVQLIDRVSAVARASGAPRFKETVPMQEPLHAALQKLELQALKKNARIHVSQDMPVIQGVADWLELIWCTLLENALKHGGDPPVIDIGCADEADGWRFWVQDNGPGLTPERRAGLFKPFHQLHRDNQAHGLGLSLVQRLVMLQGGQCGCDVVQQGSKFHFTLPKSLPVPVVD